MENGKWKMEKEKEKEIREPFARRHGRTGRGGWAYLLHGLVLLVDGRHEGARAIGGKHGLRELLERGHELRIGLWRGDNRGEKKSRAAVIKK